ncbi:hypothetical protein XFUD_08750 [Xylella fastidiosa]|uniref:Uncharacterized protein n=1 Tax=Xylella fastidiosa (strain 9a5c) TaxID=160492 RepID=Q9PBW5_XYLFA|nr:hypothetical protein XF_2020 [Xylella fastidiosa 9a5c]ALQ95219.1 hypothetical protein XFUD_08750 [Xylella fastidiosa]ARO68409.1 hypothetical protein B9J09_04600 [Xylella fastidiosa subsp. pauca]ETE32973.1 hypothetical protein B398_04950 [Xylella fastidiosa 32]OCA57594.1 hypothetical protein AA93_08575 [Xylella fastidiosa subsp. pauca 11399]
MLINRHSTRHLAPCTDHIFDQPTAEAAHDMMAPQCTEGAHVEKFMTYPFPIPAYKLGTFTMTHNRICVAQHYPDPYQTNNEARFITKRTPDARYLNHD